MPLNTDCILVAVAVLFSQFLSKHGYVFNHQKLALFSLADCGKVLPDRRTVCRSGAQKNKYTAGADQNIFGTNFSGIAQMHG